MDMKDFQSLLSAAHYLHEWVILVSMLSYFKTGHHYHSDQKQQINKMWSASYGNDKVPNLGSQMMYHDSCHILGVMNPTKHIFESMSKKGREAMSKDKEAFDVPEPFQIRFMGTPCGTARVSVAISALRSMSTTLWYEHLYDYMGKHIETIETAFKEMEREPTKYHINANLYGCDRADMTKLDRALTAVQPYVLAFIDTVHDDSKLKQQKCFMKGSDEVRGLIEVFKKIIQNETNAVKEIKTMKAFFELYEKSSLRGKVSTEDEVKREVARANAAVGQKKQADLKKP